MSSGTRSGLCALGPVRAAAAAHNRLGRVPCRHTPSASPDHGSSGARTRRNRSTLTSCRTRSEPASPDRPHRPADESGGDEITDGHQAQYGSSRERHRARSANEKIQAGDEEDPGGEESDGRAHDQGDTNERSGNNNRAPAEHVSRQEPAYPMLNIGLAKGLRPLGPSHRDTAALRAGSYRAVAAAVAGPRAGRIMIAGRPPASCSARSPVAVEQRSGHSRLDTAAGAGSQTPR